MTRTAPPAFNQKVDQQFYAAAAKAHGGELPPDLRGPDGKPRKLTMSPKDAAYRRQWNAIAATARKSRAIPGKKAGSPMSPCGRKAAPPKVVVPSKKGGMPVTLTPAAAHITPPARKVPAAPHPEKQCKLVSSHVTCSHQGRAAAGGVLCVVPDSYSDVGDRIKCDAVAEGGCGEHIEWAVSGFWTSTEHGAQASFLAKTFKPAVADGWLGLHKISPQTYQVQPLACNGEAPSVEVRAYPPDKLSGKLDFKKLHEKIREWVRHVPIEEEEKEKLEKSWLVGAVQFEQQWKEDTGSNAAFCETKVSGGFDPLFKAALPPLPVYPLSLVPPPLEKWLHAGLYVKLEGKASFQIGVIWRYSPETSHSHYDRSEASLEGELTAALSLNLFLVDKEVAHVDVSGQTGLSMGAKLIVEHEPELEFEAKWMGLTLEITLEAAWGWVEFKRKYPILPESSPLGFKYSLSSSAEGSE